MSPDKPWSPTAEQPCAWVPSSQMHDVQRLAGVGATLGEGALWRRETETVLWVDILAGEVHETTLDGVDRVLLKWPEPVSSVHLDATGNVAFTGRHGLFTMTGIEITRIASGPVRLNDGAVSPDGTLIVGTMGYPDVVPGVGSLFQVGGRGLSVLASGVTISNGIGWSADGLNMFYIDTPTQRVDIFDLNPETGEYGSRRPWAEFDAALGNPDGLCVDDQDGVWVAMWGGGKVIRLEAGQVSDVVEVPTPFVTCPTFAGPNLDKLVITTASEPFGDRPPAGAGDVYIGHVGAIGRDPNRLNDSAMEHTLG